MKRKLQYLVTILILASSSFSYSQNYSLKDSITVVTDSVFGILQEKNLYREKVDWSVYKKEFLTEALTKKSFQDFLPMFAKVWLDLGDKHTSISFGNLQIQNPQIGIYDGSEFSTALLERYQEGNFNFDCKVLDNQYGYIFMPAINLPDGKNMSQITQEMYDQIHEIASKNSIKGWIIDLRFNMGGNCWPMVGSLYELLGEGTFGGWKFEDRIEKIYLKNGEAFEGKKAQVTIKRKPIDSMDTAKVAIITGVFTGSSGEITAIAFKGRENSIFIGEKTTGLTTTNNTYPMPFGIYFNNSEGYDVDRNGQFYEQIVPDVLIQKSDNFRNLLDDANIKEAIKYFQK